jgi:hypothetical protein
MERRKIRYVEIRQFKHTIKEIKFNAFTDSQDWIDDITENFITLFDHIKKQDEIIEKMNEKIEKQNELFINYLINKNNGKSDTRKKS